MEADEIQKLVEAKVTAAITANNGGLLSSIGDMINKISSPSTTPSVPVPVFEAPKFKRRGCEEQFKFNSKVLSKVGEAEANLDLSNTAGTKQAIIEVKTLLRQRQKLVQLADASENGWRMAEEYVTHPVASDSDDERRIYKAEARASRKCKAEREIDRKRTARKVPYTVTRPQQKATYPVPAHVSGATQRPGLCFQCGKPGHWKAECLQRVSHNKISNGYVTGLNDGAREVTVPISVRRKIPEAEFSSPDGKKSPVGRLKHSVENWRKVTDSQYILDVVEYGYKLPFVYEPVGACLRNNKSARENPDFVKTEIQSLLSKGVVSEVSSVPRVVNPLTVAYGKSGKPRLVLDCRHINPCLHLFKVKFEDINIATEMFDLSSFIFTFDLKSAYHHIDIFPEHRIFLGFQWKEDDGDGDVKFYVFNSLPFGLATAGHIFTKSLRCAVKHWRESGHRVIMFLDDGIGGQSNFVDAFRSSVYVQDTLGQLGFLLAHDKCSWTPAKIAHWLGHKLDFVVNKLFVSEERISRLINALDSLLFQIQSEKLQLVPVRFLASVTGQIISLQNVLGKLVCRKTRYLHKCIDSRVGWNSMVKVDTLAVSEIVFWRENVRVLNDRGREVRPVFNAGLCAWSDASSTGYGGFLSFLNIDSVLSYDESSSVVLTDVSTGLVELPDVRSDSVVIPEVSTGLVALPDASFGSVVTPEVSTGSVMLPDASFGSVVTPEVTQAHLCSQMRALVRL